MRKLAYLIGPFIGELDWEFYRFAPYIIHLKKNNPECKFIVYTRPSRFDLYGKYADILVPLNLKSDDILIKQNFGIRRFDADSYDILIKYLYKKYSARYKIVEHIYPEISIWRNKVKWQFPRDKMDYDFKPRNKNREIFEDIFDSSSSVFVSTENSVFRHTVYHHGYDPIMINWAKDVAQNNSDGLHTSFFGSLIMLLRKCKFVVGNMTSPIVKLSLLLKIPVISVNEKMDYDSIRLLNPFDTPVINCNDLEEGVNIYENNF